MAAIAYKWQISGNFQQRPGALFKNHTACEHSAYASNIALFPASNAGELIHSENASPLLAPRLVVAQFPAQRRLTNHEPRKNRAAASVSPMTAFGNELAETGYI